ncbi:hypothetical protein NDU88_008888, partial [Pleurodeles waltl]
DLWPCNPGLPYRGEVAAVGQGAPTPEEGVPQQSQRPSAEASLGLSGGQGAGSSGPSWLEIGGPVGGPAPYTIGEVAKFEDPDV